MEEFIMIVKKDKAGIQPDMKKIVDNLRYAFDTPVSYFEVMTGCDTKFWHMLMLSSDTTSNYCNTNMTKTEFMEFRCTDESTDGTYSGPVYNIGGGRQDGHQVKLLLDKAHEIITHTGEIAVVGGHPGPMVVPRKGWPFSETTDWKSFNVNMHTTVDSFIYSMWWFSQYNLYPYENEMTGNPSEWEWKSLFDRLEGYYVNEETIWYRVAKKHTRVFDLVDLAVNNNWPEIEKQVLKITHSAGVDRSAFDVLQSHWTKTRYADFIQWRTDNICESLKLQIAEYMDKSQYMKIVRSFEVNE